MKLEIRLFSFFCINRTREFSISVSHFAILQYEIVIFDNMCDVIRMVFRTCLGCCSFPCSAKQLFFPNLILFGTEVTFSEIPYELRHVYLKPIVIVVTFKLIFKKHYFKFPENVTSFIDNPQQPL